MEPERSEDSKWVLLVSKMSPSVLGPGIQNLRQFQSQAVLEKKDETYGAMS